MDPENSFKPYEEIKDDLKFITASDVKMKIILSLKDGQKKLSDIKNRINISSSTILHNMRQLESKKFVIKEFQDYSLSQTGEIVALNLITMINSIYLAKKNKNFWLNHEISGIPEELINKIEYLCNIDVLEYKTAISMIIESFNDSKNAKCIFKDPNCEKILFEILNNKKRCINLILKDTYINEIIHANKDQETYLNKNVKLWKLNKDLKLNLIVLDNLMFLNLPYIGQNPHNISYLVIKNIEGVNWGKELFDYYLNQSEEFNLS